jgi:hypothetical protein
MVSFQILTSNFVPIHSEIDRRAREWWNTSSQVIKSYTGFDGSPSIDSLTNGFVNFMDLSRPQTFNRTYDWVMSISVGEFIPKELENVYVQNIVQPAKEGLVISWGYKLNKDVAFTNEKSNAEVAAMIEPLGFELQEDMSRKLRFSTKIAWYKRGLMVFKRSLAPPEPTITPSAEL